MGHPRNKIDNNQNEFFYKVFFVSSSSMSGYIRLQAYANRMNYFERMILTNQPTP